MEELSNSPARILKFASINRIFSGVLILSLVLGFLAGYMLSRSEQKVSPGANASSSKTPASAQQDTRTFRDFAEGVIQKRPVSKNGDEYAEGTHILKRNGAVPVTLTSSVVDLSEYEGKQVKVLGETQKAIKAGWLMDVGKVEVQN